MLDIVRDLIDDLIDHVVDLLHDIANVAAEVGTIAAVVEQAAGHVENVAVQMGLPDVAYGARAPCAAAETVGAVAAHVNLLVEVVAPA